MWKLALAAAAAFLVRADKLRIHDLQGSAHISPMVGIDVADIEGVVTELSVDGFYMQDPLPDDDVATSEGIRVRSDLSIEIGDVVAVNGTVRELRPGCAACSPSDDAFANLTTTELDASTVVRVGRAPLPDPVSLGSREGERRPPSEIVYAGSAGDIEAEAALDPARSGIDFYESLEGMRVRVDDARVVGSTVRPPGRAPEVVVVASGGAGFGPFTSSGGLLRLPGDDNPERIFVTSGAPMPDLDVGDSFTSPLVGVVDYSFGHFNLIVDGSFGLRLSPPQVRRALGSLRPDEFTLATFNVRNLGPRSAAAKFDGIARLISEDLGAPDVVVLEEIQDGSGPIDDGTTDATPTYETLVDAVAARGGPHYAFRDVPPADGEDGGDPGANIRVGFLLREDRGLRAVDRPPRGSVESTSARSVAGRVGLDASPGRLDPGNVAFEHSRKPVAIELDFVGSPIFVVGVHFTSQLGDPPLFGRFQPPDTPTRAVRTDQARIVGSFVRQVLELDAGAMVLVAGDMNDGPSSPPLAALADSGLTDVALTLPQAERYTHVFEGNAESIDHVLASPGLARNVRYAGIAHANADFARAVSDHDPVVARFVLPSEAKLDEARGCACSEARKRAGAPPWELALALFFARRGRCAWPKRGAASARRRHSL